MNSFEEELTLLKEKLFNEDCVKTYFSLKEQIEKSVELNDLRAKISFHAQTMTKNMDNDELYFKHKEAYEQVLKEYNSHPLIVDYNQVSEEVNELLVQLKNIIE